MLKYFFSTSSKPLSSTFVEKVKLTEFYKHIHPDLLHNAPERVREENSRSLKILNSYMEACNQNEKAESSTLKFYIPEKSNKKSRKFYPLEVNLENFNGSVSLDTKVKHVNRISQNLLKKLAETLKINDYDAETITRTGATEKDADQNEEEEVVDQDEPLEKKYPELFNKSLHSSIYNDNEISLRYQVNKLTHQLHKRNQHQLKEHIQRELLVIDSSSPFAVKRFANSILNDLDLKNKDETIVAYFINPDKIFYEEDITTKEVAIFMKIFQINKMEHKPDLIEKLKKIFHYFEGYDPIINLIIGRDYSTEIPHFIKIPFNFKIQELEKKIDSLFHDSVGLTLKVSISSSLLNISSFVYSCKFSIKKNILNCKN